MSLDTKKIIELFQTNAEKAPEQKFELSPADVDEMWEMAMELELKGG